MMVTVPVMSTWIEQLTYDTYTRRLWVTINGTDVEYHDVSFRDFRRFVEADSKGVFFNMYVRGRW